jgi:hypothetical protein
MPDVDPARPGGHFVLADAVPGPADPGFLEPEKPDDGQRDDGPDEKVVLDGGIDDENPPQARKVDAETPFGPR